MKDAIISILGWLLGLFFLFIGVETISDSFIAGLFLLMAAILSLPPGIRKIREKIDLSGTSRTLLILLLFIFALIVFPSTQDPESRNSDIAPVNTSDLPDKPVANEEQKSSPEKETKNPPQPTVTPSPQNTQQETEQHAESNNADESSSKNCKLRVGAFNIKIFGQSKASNQEVMNTLAKVVRKYDIVGIQEIRDSSQTALPALVSEVNEDGSKYSYVVSDRLGRTNSKEQYAYIYNTKTVELEGTPKTYPEPSNTDPFHREPYIATFKSGDFDATYLLIHTDPDEATSEINALSDVIEYVEDENPEESDIILMGDLNADGSYFNENSQNSLSKYHWLIGNSLDTTTGSTDYTYDRIITTDSAYKEFTGESGVFRFDSTYGLSSEETTAVSDHYPVYSEFSYSGTVDNTKNNDLSTQSTTTTTSTTETTKTSDSVETSTPEVTQTPDAEESTSSGSSSSEGLYVGNSDSKIYHYAGCSSAERISSEHRVLFSSKEEAEAAGYRACKRCNP